MTIAPKSSLTALRPYVPGRSPSAVTRSGGPKTLTKLSSNESLWGPSPKAEDAARQAIGNGGLASYPESDPQSLYETLAAVHGLRPEQILAGNGADELLELIALTYAGPGDEIIYPAPSFSAYRHGALLTGATGVASPLNADGAVDLEAILEHVNARTRLIFLCSPNNPTGGIIKQADWNKFCRQLPPRVLTAVDQAYFEFVTDPDYGQVHTDIAAGNPVIMVRTLSKIYALAGLRIGWAAAPADIIRELKTVRQPFSVNTVALHAAKAALQDQDYLAGVRAATIRARTYLMDSLRQRQYEFWNSHGNFVTCNVRGPAEVWARKLEQEGFITRPVGAFGLPDHLRVTIAPVPILEKFFAAFDRVAAQGVS